MSCARGHTGTSGWVLCCVYCFLPNSGRADVYVEAEHANMNTTRSQKAAGETATMEAANGRVPSHACSHAEPCIFAHATQRCTRRSLASSGSDLKHGWNLDARSTAAVRRHRDNGRDHHVHTNLPDITGCLPCHLTAQRLAPDGMYPRPRAAAAALGLIRRWRASHCYLYRRGA